MTAKSKNLEMLVDGVFLCKMYRIATQSLPQKVKVNLNIGQELIFNDRKIDLLKAYQEVDEQIELCNTFATKDIENAKYYDFAAKRLAVVRDFIENTLKDVFSLDITYKKGKVPIGARGGVLGKAFVEQIYTLSVKELPDDMQTNLHVRKQDLLINNLNNNVNGWKQAYNILDRQIKLCNKYVTRDDVNALMYPLVARRLKALQTMIASTLIGEFGVEVDVDEQGKFF